MIELAWSYTYCNLRPLHCLLRFVDSYLFNELRRRFRKRPALEPLLKELRPEDGPRRLGLCVLVVGVKVVLYEGLLVWGLPRDTHSRSSKVDGKKEKI